MLPEDWHYSTVENCADLLTGHAFASDQYVDAADASIRLLRGDNVTPGQLRWTDAKLWTIPYGKALSRYEMQNGDIVIAMDRPIINSGLKISIVGERDLPCLLVQRVARIRAKPSADQAYLSHVLGSRHFVEHLKGQKTETAVPHISPKDIRSYKFATPSKAEQQKIARVLSVWDEAIIATESVLANLRHQKLGLLRKLFKRRRNGHPAPASWTHIDLDQVFERVTRKNVPGNANVLTISGEHGLISQREYFNKSVASANLAGYTLLLQGEFAYNKSYSAGYPMGAIKPLTRYDAGVVSSLYVCFRFRDGIEADCDFFRHYFEAGLLNDELTGIAQEGARNHGLLNVGVGDFFKLRLHIPPVEKQRRIASILNAAESEERMVSEQIRLLREEKQALMQQLLTGRRRVHLPEPAKAVSA